MDKKPITKKIQVNKPKSFFALVIGDYGAILIFGKGNALEMRNYFPDISSKNIEELKKIISLDTTTPVHVLIDVLDQTFNPQSLPAVNSLSIASLVKKRLERDFPGNTLKGSLFIDRNNTGRKDWNYLFIATPYVSPVSDWINALVSLPNHIKSIGLLPVESETLISKLNKIKYPKSKSPFKIQMLVMHTKVGGIRQIVFKNNRIIFSRLISVENVDDENVLAGQFEQEIQNTIQYLSRISKSNETIEVFIVCAGPIKSALSENKDFNIYTPYELSSEFGFKNAVMQQDKFSDIVFTMLYCNSKPVLKFNTPETKYLTTLHFIFKFGRILSLLLLITTISFFMSYYFNTSSIDHQILLDQQKLNYTLNKIESRKKETRIDESESIKIMEVTSIYKSLTENQLSPINILDRISNVIKSDAIIKNYEWKTLDKSSNITYPGQGTISDNLIEASLSINFINTGSSYQELFNNFDDFVKKIEKEFSEYQVEYTRLNQQITFQETKQQIPISITLRGPIR